MAASKHGRSYTHTSVQCSLGLLRVAPIKPHIVCHREHDQVFQDLSHFSAGKEPGHEAIYAYMNCMLYLYTIHASVCAHAFTHVMINDYDCYVRTAAQRTAA